MATWEGKFVFNAFFFFFFFFLLPVPSKPHANLDHRPTHRYVNVLAFNSATTQLFNEAYNPWDDGINIHTNSVDKAPKGSALPSVVKLTRVYVRWGQSVWNSTQ